MEDPIRLLIVDDEVSFVAPLAERLGLRGLAVKTAHDGATALAMCAEEEFDVALVDLRMPGMDGEELLRRLKDDHPDLEVVILTGHASLGSAVDCTKMGAFAYLPKPFELEKLLGTVHGAYTERLQRRYAVREERQRRHLEEILDAAQYESPLGMLRRMKELEEEDDEGDEQ